MYSETFTVGGRLGYAHGATLNALENHFPANMVFINGMDVTNRAIQNTDTNGAQQVQLQVNTGDPTMDQSVAIIVKGILSLGRDPWVGKGQLPPQFYEGAAQWMLQQVPELGGMQTQPSAPVSGEMTTQASMVKEAPGKEHMKGVGEKRNRQYEHVLESLRESHPDWSEDKLKEMAARTVNKTRSEKGETKAKLAMWSVVALGELQQPGGVGLTQQQHQDNPLLEGPNPGEGINFQDNAQNSQEQEMGLQTWVNHAINLLNQGNEPELVVAQLAHDGCPEPEAALEMALKQPEKDVMDEPITDQIGQDPFEAPVADGDTGQMQDVFRQPPVVQAKVRIAGTSLTGVEIDRWEDMWGQGSVRVALDDGGTMDVAPEAIEQYDGQAPEHPVSQIQQFIDSLPKVEPTRPHIQARIDNLELVRRAVRSTISKVGFSDQVKLMGFDNDAQSEIEALKESLGATISESDVAYLSGQQTYRPHGLDLPGVEKASIIDPDFQKKIAEKAAIFVAELSDEAITDAEVVAYAAARYASEHNGNVQEFVRLAEENRVVRMDEFSPVEESTEPPADYEGPAEGIYL